MALSTINLFMRTVRPILWQTGMVRGFYSTGEDGDDNGVYGNSGHER